MVRMKNLLKNITEFRQSMVEIREESTKLLRIDIVLFELVARIEKRKGLIDALDLAYCKQVTEAILRNLPTPPKSPELAQLLRENQIDIAALCTFQEISIPIAERLSHHCDDMTLIANK